MTLLDLVMLGSTGAAAIWGLIILEITRRMMNSTERRRARVREQDIERMEHRERTLRVTVPVKIRGAPCRERSR